MTLGHPSAAESRLPVGEVVRPPAQKHRATTLFLVAAAITLCYLALGARTLPGAAVPFSTAPAPEFTAPGFGGEDLRLADFRGKAVVLNFWASWCPPCRAEALGVERVWRAYRDQGAVIVGIDIQDSESAARGFLADFGITYPNARDTVSEASRQYGVNSIPTTFFIDREGRLRDRWVGPMSEQQLAARVEELLR